MQKGLLTSEEYERLRDEERANALQDENEEISLEEVESAEEHGEDDDPFAEEDPQDER